MPDDKPLRQPIRSSRVLEMACSASCTRSLNCSRPVDLLASRSAGARLGRSSSSQRPVQGSDHPHSGTTRGTLQPRDRLDQRDAQRRRLRGAKVGPGKAERAAPWRCSSSAIVGGAPEAPRNAMISATSICNQNRSPDYQAGRRRAARSDRVGTRSATPPGPARSDRPGIRGRSGSARAQLRPRQQQLDLAQQPAARDLNFAEACPRLRR